MENIISNEAINEKLDYLINLVASPEKEIFDMYESADYLRISYSSLIKEVNKGNIRYKILGNKRLFKKEWLDDWMEV